MSGSVPQPDSTKHALGLLTLVLLSFPIAGLLLPVIGLPYETAVLAYPVLGLLIWFGVARRSWGDLVVLDSSRTAGPLWALLGCLAAFVTATMFIGSAEVLSAGSVELGDPAVGDIISAVVLTVLVAVLLTAVPEELIYRGAFLSLAQGRIRPAAAITASAALFGFAHLPNLLTQETGTTQILLRLLELALFGALMGWSVLRTGSVWLALGWHSGSNAAHVGVQLLFASDADSSGWTGRWLELAVSLVIVVLLTRIARRNLRCTGNALGSSAQEPGQ